MNNRKLAGLMFLSDLAQGFTSSNTVSTKTWQNVLNESAGSRSKQLAVGDKFSENKSTNFTKKQIKTVTI